jgi:hypothetical protein
MMRGVRRGWRKKCESFLAKWPDAEFGPAHILVADGNYRRLDIAFCLEALERGGQWNDHDPQEIAETRAFLQSLWSDLNPSVM